MKRVILTSSAGVGLALADRADMVIPFIYRFVSGPLPTADHLIRYLGWRESRTWVDQMHWSDCVPVRQSPLIRRQDRAGALLWVCKNYGVDLIELWFDPEPNSQLQLIWILNYLRFEPSLTESLRLRLVDFDLRGADPSELRHRDVKQFDIAESDLESATLAWEAYRAPTPELCVGLLDRPLGKLSFLKPAMEDLLSELPSPGRPRRGFSNSWQADAVAPMSCFGQAPLRLVCSIRGSWARCSKGSHSALRQRLRVWTASWRHSIRTTRAVATPPFAGAGCR
ncbi:hypothetical protein [Bradyrhizobium ottawaense]|uniref:hypothetical protein n=1 Tax=Bradyrhizobium ottawaense TaxID=931866 RepID=UPI003FA0A205